MEDEISTVTNYLSKLGDQMIQMRQDMTALSGNMRAEIAEMKNILLGMNKKTVSPRRKTHRRTKESEAASSSSNDGKRQQRQEFPLRRTTSHGTVCANPRLNATFAPHRQW
jgi:hypothetical protein